MVGFVMEKMAKTEREATSLNAIAERFTKEISNVKADEENQDAQEKPVDDDMFDPTANVLVQSMSNMGMSVGSLVAPKGSDPKSPAADIQYEIAYINEDGSIALQSILKDGTLDKYRVEMVDQATMAASYKPVDQSSRLSLLPAIAPVSVTDSVVLYTSAALLGIHSLFSQFPAIPEQAIYIQQTPSQKVIVNQGTLRKGDVSFLPWAVGLKARKDGLEHGICVLVFTPGGGKLVFEMDKPDPTKGDCHVWRLRKTSEEEHCNMKMEMMDLRVPVLKLQCAAVTAGFVKSILVQVPRAVLTRNVKQGDELVLHVPSKPKAVVEKRAMPMVTTKAKAQKSKPC